MRFFSCIIGLGLGFGIGAEASLLGRQVTGTASSATVQASSSTSSAFVLATPSSAATVNSSNHDLSQHFCRIWRHSSMFISLVLVVWDEMDDERTGIGVEGQDVKF